MNRQQHADNIIRSIYDHIDLYLSTRNYSENPFSISTSKTLLKNRVISGSDNIDGFTRVSSNPQVNQYTVINYGGKGNSTNLQFNASNSSQNVEIEYQYKPVLMLSWQETFNQIDKEQVSTPAVWFEIDSEIDQEYDQGKSTVEDTKILSIGFYADVRKNGSFDVSQRDGIKEELKSALSSNIKLKDYSVSPAISTSGIITVGRVKIDRIEDSGRFANGMEGSAVIKVKLPDDIE